MNDPKCTCNEDGTNIGIDNPDCPVHGEEIMNQGHKRQTGREYGSGRNKQVDPRDEHKTYKFDLDDLIDAPDDLDPFDDLTVESILKYFRDNK